MEINENSQSISIEIIGKVENIFPIKEMEGRKVEAIGVRYQDGKKSTLIGALLCDDLIGPGSLGILKLGDEVKLHVYPITSNTQIKYLNNIYPFKIEKI